MLNTSLGESVQLRSIASPASLGVSTKTRFDGGSGTCEKATPVIDIVSAIARKSVFGILILLWMTSEGYASISSTLALGTITDSPELSSTSKTLAFEPDPSTWGSEGNAFTIPSMPK